MFDLSVIDTCHFINKDLHKRVLNLTIQSHMDKDPQLSQVRDVAHGSPHSHLVCPSV